MGEEERDEYKETLDYYLWTHKKLDIGYNGNRIVDVNLTSESKKKLVEGTTIGFTYEVNWKKSNIKFEDRFDKYLDPNFFQHRVSNNELTTTYPTNKKLLGQIMLILRQ